ncbi:MAG: protein kinase, partial [Bacteroidota bacterium]
SPQGHQLRSILVSTGGMTPAYCSPEQANKQPLSRRSDIWSWAVSVLEMFVGGVCWQSGAAAQAVLEQLNEARAEGVDLPEMPNDVRALLRNCFEFDPEDRPQSFKDILMLLLEAYQSGLKEDYRRLEPASMKLRADGLNNRAVSLFDLGREQAASLVFEEALKIDPSHVEAIYNRGLLQWRKAQMTDQSLLAALRGASADADKNLHGKLALGLVHLERGDKESALHELEAAAKRSPDAAEVSLALQRATNANDSRRCIQTFVGHTSFVSCFAVSSDGRRGLSGSYDNTIRLWELETGRCLRLLEGHTDRVKCIAMSPDGRWVLSAAEYNDSLWLWELATGQHVRTFEGHTSHVTSVAISPDGRFALSGSIDSTLRLWKVETGKCVRMFEGPGNSISCVVILPAGRRALSVDYHGLLHLWDLARMHFWNVGKNRPTRTFEGHTSIVSSIAVSANERWVLSGSFDHRLRLWELESGKCVRTFEGHTDLVTSVAISRDGRWGWSIGDDGT